MRPVFIVLSAINVHVGIFDPAVRILQTHGTLDSIRRVFPDACLVLVEGGDCIAEGRTDAQVNRAWRDLCARCAFVLGMDQHAQIRHLQESFFARTAVKQELGGTTGIAKSAAELALTAAALNALMREPMLQSALRDAGRVFKISGRYQLSPAFDAALYDSAQAAGRYVLQRRQPSWMPDAAATIGVAHCCSSRLWSFPAALLDETIAAWSRIMADFAHLSQTRYIDVEHLLCKHLAGAQCLEVSPLHVFGSLAPNGMPVYD